MLTPPLPGALASHARCIDHVAVAVRDLEASVAWYTRALGFTAVGRRETRGAHTGMVSNVMRAGEVVVVLTQGTSPESQVSRYVAAYGAGVTHVAVCVRELEAAVDALREGGVGFATPVIRSPGLLQAFTARDPGSGMMLELIQRDGGDFTDASVEQLFRMMEASDHF